jgi:hypothetical protein
LDLAGLGGACGELRILRTSTSNSSLGGGK